MRCGNKIVNTGDTISEVVLTCGQPIDIQSVGLKEERGGFVKIERYTYVFGKGKLAKILEFHGGKLVEISNGPRM